MHISFTLRTMFKCPFGFGLLFVNNLLRVWYIISIFSVFDVIGMLLVGGRDFRRPMIPITFYGLYFYLSKTCPFKFYGAISFIALVVLQVFPFRRPFISLPFYGVLLLKIFLVRPSMLQFYSFMDSEGPFLWTRQPYSFEQWTSRARHFLWCRQIGRAHV